MVSCDAATDGETDIEKSPACSDANGLEQEEDDAVSYKVAFLQPDASEVGLLRKSKRESNQKRDDDPPKSWKKYLPYNCFKDPNVSARSNAGFFEYFTLMWISPIIYHGLNHTLTLKDLGTLSSAETAESCWKRFLHFAKINSTDPEEIKNVRFGHVFFKLIRKKYFILLFVYFCWLSSQFITATFAVRNILAYVESTEEMPLHMGFRWAILLFAMEFSRSVASCSVFFTMSQAGSMLRSTMLSLVYNKLLRLKNVGDKSVGELINLCANDSQRLFECAQFSIFLFGAVYLISISTAFVWYYFGPTALVGIGILLLFLPLQALMGKFVGKLRQKTIAITDRRVRLISEILTCIKLIKMYAWEKPFAKMILNLRKREKNKLAHMLYMQTFNFSMGFILPILAPLAVFIVHSLLGYDITVTKAYTVVAIFTTFPATLSLLPFAVKGITEGSVAIKRLKNLLMMDELKVYAIPPNDPDIGLRMTDCCFSWDKVTPKGSKKEIDSDEENNDNDIAKNGSVKTEFVTKSRKLESNFVNIEKTLVPVLYDISFTVPKGSLVGICGPVGCGKSSLIDAILGQMTMTKGVLEAETPIAYVPQQAWIMNATAKENIIFGTSFDQELYSNVCHSCSLEQDFKLLPSGDLTEIGERGVNLSGGQKQRLSLARAVYHSQANTYLLDDPLSAVDAHVGQHIFKNCIQNSLKDKTVVLITHQLQYLSSCDTVLYIVNGRIAESGDYNQLMDDGKEFSAMINKFHPEKEEEFKEDKSEELQISLERRPSDYLRHDSLLEAQSTPDDVIDNDELSEEKQLKGKLISEEERSSGSVSWPVYKAYCKAAGGYFISAFVILVIGCVVVLAAMIELWLTRFLTAYKEFKSASHLANRTYVTMNDFPERNYYVAIYGIMGACEFVLLCFSVILSMTVMINASTSLHNNAFSSLLKAPMSFFDSTPIGRILNRLSKDIDDIDTMLPWYFENFLRNSSRLFISFTIIAIVFPWFLVALSVLFVIFVILNILFRKSMCQIKRLDNTTRSPIFSQITATVQGLSTLHAYGKHKAFEKQFYSHVDTNATPFLFFWLSNRWFGVRLDIVGVCVCTTVAIIIITLKGTVPASLAGLSLIYSLRVTGLLQFTSRVAAETEARFTSVERINHYVSGITHEAAAVVAKSLPEGEWPKLGSITFSNVCLRYREEMPLVLKNISFSINAEEKIGVVGRTGAGKSSLAVALFRLTEIESGTITIDDVDISTIGLQQLRSNIAVIPQDPVLFVGTLRYNLDPFDNQTDADIWNALDKAHLKEMVEMLPLKLQTHIVENGSNFSVGERQLICMARALLRHSKVLILDEATAAIDSETDSKIQDMIRCSFKSCTMFTIAHRINTVLDSDKILVLDKGQVIEFASPTELLEDTTSSFYKIVTASNVATSNFKGKT